MTMIERALTLTTEIYGFKLYATEIDDCVTKPRRRRREEILETNKQICN